jgi:hypothetical protein
MKCDELEVRIQQLLDDRRRPESDADVRAHIERCGRCRALVDTYSLAFSGLRSLALPEPSADLADRVIDQVRVQPSTLRRHVSVAAAALAAAAAVLVAVLPLLNSARRPTVDMTVASAPAAPYIEFDLNDLNRLPLVGAVLVSIADGDPVTDPYEILAQQTGQGLALVVLYMPGAGSMSVMDVSADAVESETAWAGPIGDGFRPVAQTVTETLNLLLQAVPMADLAWRS